MKNNNLNKIYKAINTYALIQENDKVAVGLSGGKDSLLLLDLLNKYKSTCGFDFELIAITIDMGFPEANFTALEKFVKERNIEYKIVKSTIADIVFNVRKEKNPCSLCAKLRRGILCSTSKELHCTKLALGHHMDDCVETFFLSLLFEGRLSSFSPCSYMSNTNITVIRPMILMSEEDVKKSTCDFPICHNPCPANKHTKRETVKNLLGSLEEICPDAKKNILRALQNPDRNNLW